MEQITSSLLIHDLTMHKHFRITSSGDFRGFCENHYRRRVLVPLLILVKPYVTKAVSIL